MDEQRQSDLLWSVFSRVVAGLSSLAVATVVIRGIVRAFTRSQDWIAGQIREAFRKELK